MGWGGRGKGKFGLRMNIIIYLSSLAEGLSRYDLVLYGLWECVNYCNCKIRIKGKILNYSRTLTNGFHVEFETFFQIPFLI